MELTIEYKNAMLLEALNVKKELYRLHLQEIELSKRRSFLLHKIKDITPNAQPIRGPERDDLLYYTLRLLTKETKAISFIEICRFVEAHREDLIPTQIISLKNYVKRRLDVLCNGGELREMDRCYYT